MRWVDQAWVGNQEVGGAAAPPRHARSKKHTTGLLNISFHTSSNAALRLMEATKYRWSIFIVHSTDLELIPIR